MDLFVTICAWWIAAVLVCFAVGTLLDDRRPARQAVLLLVAKAPAAVLTGRVLGWW